jgi:hypothetical protein
MKISDREITKKELEDIYEDFKRIEIQDGVPANNQMRYKFIAEEKDNVIGL